MRLLRRILLIVIVLPILLTLLLLIGSRLYIQSRADASGLSYSETVENMLVDLVPEEGVSIRGRTYYASSVRNFLDEIRYDPYNYVHKDHHCILAYLPDDEIHQIVTLFRWVMGCR